MNCAAGHYQRYQWCAFCKITSLEREVSDLRVLYESRRARCLAQAAELGKQDAELGKRRKRPRNE